MPTYDYVCEKCDHAFEEFQSITAKPLRKCPSCGKPGLKRLIGTGAGVIFKGSGFYETDYRSPTYKKAAQSEGAVATESSKADGGKAGAADKTGDGAASASPKSSAQDAKSPDAGGKATGGSKSTPAS